MEILGDGCGACAELRWDLRLLISPGVRFESFGTGSRTPPSQGVTEYRGSTSHGDRRHTFFHMKRSHRVLK